MGYHTYVRSQATAHHKAGSQSALKAGSCFDTGYMGFLCGECIEGFQKIAGRPPARCMCLGLATHVACLRGR
jgi:hypothetical protein